MDRSSLIDPLWFRLLNNETVFDCIKPEEDDAVIKEIDEEVVELLEFSEEDFSAIEDESEASFFSSCSDTKKQNRI